MNGELFSKLKGFFPRFWTHSLHFGMICQNEMSHFFENGSTMSNRFYKKELIDFSNFVSETECIQTYAKMSCINR